MYFFVLITGTFVLSFISRENIRSYVDVGNDKTCIYREYSEGSGGDFSLSAGLVSSDLCGGIVMDADSDFEHRFFYVSSFEGYVAVFNCYGSLVRITDIVAENVRIEMREVISERVYFETLGDVDEFLLRL